MKKWWFGEKKHIDEEKVAERKEAKKDLRWLAERGTESELIAYLKALNPNVTNDQLAYALARFHEDRTKQKRD